MENITPDNIQPIKGIPIDEAECIVIIDRAEEKAHIYVSDNVMLNKIIRKWKKNPDEYKVEEVYYGPTHNVVGYDIDTIKSNITFRSGKREVSEEQRKKISERAKKLVEEGKFGKGTNK